jgi:hypothetical protein
MSRPVAVVITGIDRQEFLDQALVAVKTYRPMDKPLSLRSWEERVRRPTRANPSYTTRAGTSTGQRKILTGSV